VSLAGVCACDAGNTLSNRNETKRKKKKPKQKPKQINLAHSLYCEHCSSGYYVWFFAQPPCQHESRLIDVCCGRIYKENNKKVPTSIKTNTRAASKVVNCHSQRPLNPLDKTRVCRAESQANLRYVTYISLFYSLSYCL